MDFSQLKYCADGEYPKAQITKRNLEDAYLLQADYASPKSETTAILTYSYQSYLIEPLNKDIAEIIHKISIVEMHHHQMLAEMILQSGGNPVIGARGSYWDGSFVDYSKNIIAMLTNDIVAEKTAINNYQMTIAYLNNRSIVPVIQRIIEDEKVHVETLTALLQYVTSLKTQNQTD